MDHGGDPASVPIPFADVFFSRNSFKDNLWDPLHKLYQQDAQFLDFAANYCSIFKRLSIDLDKLKKKYEQSTGKTAIPSDVNKSYISFSEFVSRQSVFFSQYADDIQNGPFGGKLRNSLGEQKRELGKLFDEVDRSDKALSDSISMLRARRKNTASILQECEKVEDKRPDMSAMSKEVMRYKTVRVTAAKKLDGADTEYLSACSEANKARVKFESTIRRSLERYQEVSTERVDLISQGFAQFQQQFVQSCQAYSECPQPVSLASAKINPTNEVKEFVEINSSKSRIAIEPELILFDIPGLRDDGKKYDSDTKAYTVKQMKKEVAMRKIAWLKKKEEEDLKNIELVKVIMAKERAEDTGLKAKFSDADQSQQEYFVILSELDILQMSMSNLISDYNILNKRTATSEGAPYLQQFVAPVYDGRNLLYCVIKPPAEYYLNTSRSAEPFSMPAMIQTEVEDLAKGGSSPNNSLPRTESQSIPGKAATMQPTSPVQPQASVSDARSHTVRDDSRGDSFDDEIDDDFSWKAVVKFSFDPKEQYPPDEDTSYMLKVVEGQTVTVLESLAEDWCLAKDLSGRTGHVPLQFIESSK